MREIKFRAKYSGVAGAWALSEAYGKGGLRIFLELLENGKLDVKTLGEYTGLKDKNGKEIYEGDIVSVPYITPLGKLLCDTEDRKSFIKFINGGFYEFQNPGSGRSNREKRSPLSNWQEKGKTEYIANYGEYTELLDKTVLEVIGNIYEDPDPLESKNEST